MKNNPAKIISKKFADLTQQTGFLEAKADAMWDVLIVLLSLLPEDKKKEADALIRHYVESLQWEADQENEGMAQAQLRLEAEYVRKFLLPDAPESGRASHDDNE